MGVRRRWLWGWFAAAALGLLGGCASEPFLENPALFRPDPNVSVENPVFIPLGGTPSAYNMVFDKVLSIISGYFEVSDTNRFGGEIKTFPRIAPGLERPFKPGSPDFDERLLATLQTIQHRAFVRIQPADDGGFFIDVKVFKELEDLPRPTRATAGAASFRSDNTIERQYEVVDPAVFQSNWIPMGRDEKLEQAILQKIRKCM